VFLGINSEIRGNLVEAVSYAEEGLAFFQQARDVIHTAATLAVLAAVRASLGDKEGARRCCDEMKRLPSCTSNRRALGAFLQNAAFNMQYNYRLYDTARILYQASLVHWREIQRLESGFSIVRALMGLAEIASIQGDAARAGWLFGAGDHLTPPSGPYRDTLIERVAPTREQLDKVTRSTFEAAWADGHAAALEQAIEKALEECEPAP
jgi:hypothetical protein